MAMFNSYVTAYQRVSIIKSGSEGILVPLPGQLAILQATLEQMQAPGMLGFAPGLHDGQPVSQLSWLCVLLYYFFFEHSICIYIYCIIFISYIYIYKFRKRERESNKHSRVARMPTKTLILCTEILKYKYDFSYYVFCKYVFLIIHEIGNIPQQSKNWKKSQLLCPPFIFCPGVFQVFSQMDDHDLAWVSQW